MNLLWKRKKIMSRYLWMFVFLLFSSSFWYICYLDWLFVWICAYLFVPCPNEQWGLKTGHLFPVGWTSGIFFEYFLICLFLAPVSSEDSILATYFHFLYVCKLVCLLVWIFARSFVPCHMSSEAWGPGHLFPGLFVFPLGAGHQHILTVLHRVYSV